MSTITTSNVVSAILTDELVAFAEAVIALKASVNGVPSKLDRMDAVVNTTVEPAPVKPRKTRSDKGKPRGPRKTTTEPAPTIVKNAPVKPRTLNTWEMSVAQRMERYNSDLKFWNGVPSRTQRKRVTDTAKRLGWIVEMAGMRAFEAAENYAMMEADAHGVAFEMIYAI